MFKGSGSAGYADLPAKLNWGMDVGGLAQGGKTLSLAKISADLTVNLTDLAEQQHLLPPQSFDIEFTGKVQYEIDAQAAKRLTTCPI